MSQSVFQPIGQKRLTNVAVVRYKKHGKRFEIACYKNKVVNWRNGVERDLDEVLQSATIFSNVSKGVLAKREDLQLVFGTDNEDAICRIILAEGELQVSDKERKVELDTLFRDVASVLSEKCINPETNRPYTLTMLERALKDAHFSVDPKRPAKTQALEALPSLKARFPIERARMRLRMLVPLSSKDEAFEMLAARDAVLEEEEILGPMLSVTCLVEPGAYRPLHALVQGAGGGGRVEVVSLAATADEADASTAIEMLSFGAAQRPQQQPPEPRPPSAGAAAAGAAGAAAAPGDSGLASAAALPAKLPAPGAAPSAPAAERVVCARGPIQQLPEEHASRRERFAELDTLQPGWTVELRSRSEGGTVEAVFFSPAGERAGSYAVARRMGLQARKEAAAAVAS